MKKAFFISALLLCIILSSCSARYEAPSTDGTTGSANRSESNKNAYDNSNESENSDESKTDLSVYNQENSDHKIIVTAEMEVETKDFAKATENILKTVEECGGYIESSQVYKTELHPTAKYVVRIPADAIKNVEEQLSVDGKIVSYTQSGEDVTIAFYDIQSQIQALKVQEERILSILEKAETLKDILELENELNRIRTKIESLTTNLNALSNKVNYSTLTLHIDDVNDYTEPAAEKSFGGKVKTTFTQSFGSAGKFLQGLFLSALWVLPYAIIIGIILTVIIVLKKRLNKKK